VRRSQIGQSSVVVALLSSLKGAPWGAGRLRLTTSSQVCSLRVVSSSPSSLASASMQRSHLCMRVICSLRSMSETSSWIVVTESGPSAGASDDDGIM
jgi:hypothetical protein